MKRRAPNKAKAKRNARGVELVRAVCDHLAETQTGWGRPDPGRTPFATGKPWSELVVPTMLHAPGFAALALYRAGLRLGRADYIAAADRYLLYLLAVVRDPCGGRWDRYCARVNAYLRMRDGRDAARESRHLMSRSWMIGIALDVLCRGFMAAHPGETSFHSKAAALYDWLQVFRTNRGPYFRIGYQPSGLSAGRAVDGAFTDDLGLVARGLASYYALSGRKDVLRDLVGLAGYYLRAHEPNSDAGAFSEKLGSWVVCPWPLVMAGEHFPKKSRADRFSWGFSARDGIDPLSRLSAWVADDRLKAQIRDRLVRVMKWVFDQCQFDSGGVGMMRRDDAFTGMAGAGIMNYLDCRAAGLLSPVEQDAYGGKARKALGWICAWSPRQIIKAGGHRRVNGGVTLNPPENLAWMLAWTAEALLQAEAL